VKNLSSRYLRSEAHVSEESGASSEVHFVGDISSSPELLELSFNEEELKPEEEIELEMDEEDKVSVG